MSGPRSEPNFIRSLWHDTMPVAAARAALDRSISADVVVVGGGYAGLSTALHLAEAGRSAVVLEAAQIGSGGSGLNGGQVNPGMKYDPDEIDAAYDADAASVLIRFVGGLAQRTFALIDRHGIECDAKRGGFVQPAHNAATLQKLRSRYEQWSKRGAPARFLDAAEIRDLLGTDHYIGGWVDERGGTLHPLKFVRGLAAAAERHGAQLFENSPATRIKREAGSWVVSTPRGQVRAPKLAIMTNAYADGLWPRLARSFVPVHSFQISSAPLPADVLDTLVPDGHGVSDMRRLLVYFRRGPGGRLLIGGRGTLRAPRSERDFQALEQVLRRRFPQIGDAEIDHRWYGRVAITTDAKPRLYVLGEQAIALTGCNGRGVAMYPVLGEHIAKWFADECTDAMPLPLQTHIGVIPLHGLNRLYVAGASAWYRMQDWVG
jgi:glycine/D-amino acid oxidase-like deaminating enzyme